MIACLCTRGISTVCLPTVHALDEAVGARRADFSRAMLDVVEGRQELVGVLLWPAGELAAVIGIFEM